MPSPAARDHELSGNWHSRCLWMEDRRAVRSSILVGGENGVDRVLEEFGPLQCQRHAGVARFFATSRCLLYSMPGS